MQFSLATILVIIVIIVEEDLGLEDLAEAFSELVAFSAEVWAFLEALEAGVIIDNDLSALLDEKKAILRFT